MARSQSCDRERLFNSKLLIAPTRTVWTPSSRAPVDPARHTGWVNPNQLATFRALHPSPSEDGSALRALPAARCLSPISATNLLSSAPAGSLNSRTPGSRRDRPPLPALRPRSHTFVRVTTHSFPRQRWLAASGSPASSKSTIGAVLQAETIPTLPRGVPGFPERDARRPVESYASREHVAPDASCRASQLTRTAPGSPKGARTLSTSHAPTHEAFQARSAFPRQVPATSPLAEANDAACLSRHWCLHVSASAQLPTCVHTRLSRARPTPYRLLPRSS